MLVKFFLVFFFFNFVFFFLRTVIASCSPHRKSQKDLVIIKSEKNHVSLRNVKNYDITVSTPISYGLQIYKPTIIVSNIIGYIPDSNE